MATRAQNAPDLQQTDSDVPHGYAVDTAADDAQLPGPQLMAADALLGNDVIGDDGEKLGELSHIMIDLASGRTAYGILSVGGVLGMGDKLIAVPWGALRPDPDNEALGLSVTKEELEQAEGLEKDDWSSMTDPQWVEEVHEYYGVEPYWRR